MHRGCVRSTFVLFSEQIPHPIVIIQTLVFEMEKVRRNQILSLYSKIIMEL